MVYESKSYSTVPATYTNYTHQLQFAAHEEGRIRAIRHTPQSTTPNAFVYDFLLKDHLGNVRHTSVQYYYPTLGAPPPGDGLNTLLGGLASLITNSSGAGGLIKTASTTLAQGVGLDPMVVSFFPIKTTTQFPASQRPT